MRYCSATKGKTSISRNQKFGCFSERVAGGANQATPNHSFKRTPYGWLRQPPWSA